MRHNPESANQPPEARRGQHPHVATLAKSAVKIWNACWMQLIQPAASVKRDENRRQAQLLAALLVALLLVVAAIVPMWVFANPDFPETVGISIGIITALSIAYVLSRTRYYRPGAYILVATFPAIVTAVIFAAPGPMTERMLAVDFLAVGILLTSILLSVRETILFSLFCLVYVSVFLFVPGVPFAIPYSYLVFIGTMSALFVVSIVIRNDYVRRLHQSEYRYRSLFEQSNDAVFILDLQGKHLHVNQRTADMLGYTPGEIVGLSFRDLVVPEQHYQSENVLQRLVAGERLPLYERTFRRKDGSLLPVEINVELVKDLAGLPLHIQSIVRDITERKQVEEMLRIQRDLAVALSSTSNLIESLDQFLEVSVRIEGVDCGGMYLVDEKSGSLNLVTHRGLPDAFVEKAAHYDARARQTRLVMKGKAIHQHYADILPEDRDPVQQREGLRAISVMPIQHEGRIIAASNCASHTHDELPARSRTILETLSAGIGETIARIQAETALKESQHNLQTLFDTMEDFVLILDENGCILETNPVLQRRLGYTADELSGELVLIVHPPERHEETMRIIQSMLKGTETSCLVPLMTKDRTLIPVETKVTPGQWGGRKVLFGLSRDITERERMVSALREREVRYRSMFEDNISVKLLIDPGTGGIVDANSAAADYYGYSVDQLKSMCIQDINTLTDEEIRAEMALARSQQRKVFFFRHRLSSGEVRDVEVFSGPLAIEGKQYLFSIIHDITERKAFENALRESEGRQRALLSAIPDIVFRIRHDGTYLDYHARNMQDLAALPDQFMGRKIAETLPSEFADQQMRFIEQALRTGEEQIYEYALPINGQVLDFEARMVVSAPDEVIIIIRNITERKRTQQQAFELALEKARVQLLRNFVEKAAHEFRTPLSIINTTTYILSRADDHETRQIKASIVEEQVMRLTRLLDMLLIMTRLESRPSPVPSPVDMDMILKSVCQKMEKRGRNLTLNCPAHPKLSFVMGNADDLEDAVEQILDNACRFTPAGGTVTVNAGTEHDQVWLEVADTGPGIAEEHLPHIFETFWRLDEAHTTPGFGLGLPIAKRIVELYGGVLTVKSEMGVGTAFRITLPVTIG